MENGGNESVSVYACVCVRCGAHILHFVFEESNLTVLRFVNGFSTQAITYYYIVLFDRKSVLVRKHQRGSAGQG